MHHLEPLSWHAGSTSAPAITQQHAALTKRVTLTSEGSFRENLDHARCAVATQAIFRLISAFRRGVDQSVAPTSLAAIAQAALELTRLEFARLDWGPSCSSRFRSDGNHCISGLEGLVDALSGDQSLSALELIHAMDTLIALLVQADGARRIAGHIAS